MTDISNRELKEVLIGMKDSYKESTESLKSFINQTNVNVAQLNDNLITHSKNSIERDIRIQEKLSATNKNLVLIGKVLSKGGFWFLIALVIFALIAIGREVIAQQLLGIVV